MRLSCFELGIDILFEENKINVLVIENQRLFTEFLERLSRQSAGEDSGILVSEEDKKLVLGKCVGIVYSPMLLELNNKRMQTYLFQEMKNLSDDYFFEEKERINSEIVSYLDQLSQRLPYPIYFNLELDPVSLFKGYDVHVNFESLSLPEKLANFIQLEKILCNTKLVVLVNIKAYLDGEQLKELYKCAFYNKMHLLLLEFDEKDCLPEEQYCIIDADKCVILHG